MKKHLALAAFLLGLVTVVWVGAGYVGNHLLGFTITLLIGAIYTTGALEMLRFRQATDSLAAALEAIPEQMAQLGDWLGRVHPTLQTPVRLRIEGERVALPGPALTPYLAALLVMLGMLGTFLGMVVTLNGAVIALESTTDLQTIRAALAAPIKGLGLAFGTSVAGVAASAMLGLVSALCRRERQRVAQLLDAKIATALRAFSHTHQRDETFKALQVQARTMPEVVDKLHALMEMMDRQQARHTEHFQQMNERLLAGHQGFLHDVKGIHAELAGSVDRSLKESLTQSVRVAGEAIAPVVEATMAGVARETEQLHQRTADAMSTRIEDLTARFDAAIAGVVSELAARDDARQATLAQSMEAMAASLQREWREAGAQTLAQQQQICAIQERTADTVSTRIEGLTERFDATIGGVVSELAARDEARQATLAQSMEAMAASLQREWREAGAQTLAQQQQICATLERTANGISEQAQAHARDTIAEIAQLMQTASEAPRAAAEVIATLRQEMSNGVARDNELLEERGRIMETLNALLDAINHATTQQRGAIDALVTSSTAMLDRVSGDFAGKIEAESNRMADMAAQATGAAVEVASLGETLGFAVRQFGEANDKLIENLQRIEASLDRSMTRNDEQLAYYVAQAREIIDLSLMSQKQVMDKLHGVASGVN